MFFLYKYKYSQTHTHTHTHTHTQSLSFWKPLYERDDKELPFKDGVSAGQT